MFYMPRSKDTGLMWDTWLYWHEGTYFLFYLAKSKSDERWDNISLATSDNGVHWKEHGVILSRKPDAVWMGTGSTWASPNFERDGKFFINFSEWQGDQQTIFFGESTDLTRWTRLGDELEFKPDAHWYNVGQRGDSRWDCIFTTPRDEGGLWGYWTATPSAHYGVGFGRSDDGIAWEALEPPKIEPPLQGHCEHGAVARVGETYYHMLGIEGGMYTYLAERPQGPLRRAEKNAALLTSGDDALATGARYTYFARFFHAPDGLLVNHHSIGRDGQVYFGLLKRAVFDDEGTFRLGWCDGNDVLKDQSVEISQPPEVEGSTPRMIEQTLDAANGFVMEGRLRVPSDGDESAGLYIETGKGRGTGILVGPGAVTDLGPMQADGGAFQPESRIDRQYPFGHTPPLRLIVKRDLLEFYLEDILIQCYSLPTAATGRVGLIGSVTDVVAWK